MSVLDQEEQVIHCLVRDLSNPWCCTLSIVYGDNCYRKRETKWDNLVSFASGISGRPWLVVGDFNAVRRMNERAGGSQDWPSWMSSLEDTISQAELADLPRAKKAFKFFFFYFWVDHPEFLPLVEKIWQEEGEGSPHVPIMLPIAKSEAKVALRKQN